MPAQIRRRPYSLNQHHLSCLAGQVGFEYDLVSLTGNPDSPSFDSKQQSLFRGLRVGERTTDQFRIQIRMYSEEFCKFFAPSGAKGNKTRRSDVQFPAMQQ